MRSSFITRSLAVVYVRLGEAFTWGGGGGREGRGGEGMSNREGQKRRGEERAVSRGRRGKRVKT